MRRPMMAGNWKMYNSIGAAVTLAQAIQAATASDHTVDKVVCPAFVCLPAVSQALQGSGVAVGAQNMHWSENGPFTGEVSGAMLQGLATHVIIGHSERRQYFAESDETVQRKTLAALHWGLVPIVCVGESLAQNQAGETHAVVGSQVTAALQGLDAAQVPGVIIAYEPIWAIGTGLAATAAQANEICGHTVRATVASLCGDQVAQATRVLYGGSTKPGNIGEIMAQPEIDGALIGGASLQAGDYSEMVRITAALYGR